MSALTAVLAQIAEGKTPRVILVGGDSDYLAEQAFHEIRDTIVAKHPGIALEVYEPGADLGAILDSYRIPPRGDLVRDASTGSLAGERHRAR